uniref:Ricin B lectin n=1 Tax=Trepomonas sp. PC1 TaxID=1076344 RepID=A0A146KCG2_9EUKA|eukprot:JAP94453.1 Ricin B lectin [Trepomonas sp. PC1]
MGGTPNMLPQHGMSYSIECAQTPGMCVDIRGSLRTNGADATNYQRNGGANQKFKVHKGPTGFQLFAHHSNMALGVRNRERGALVEQRKEQDSSIWNIQPSGDGFFYINMTGTNLYMEIEHGDTHNGAKLVLNNQTGQYNQKWKFSPF